MEKKGDQCPVRCCEVVEKYIHTHIHTHRQTDIQTDREYEMVMTHTHRPTDRDKTTLIHVLKPTIFGSSGVS